MLLAIDTSTRTLGIALFDGVHVLLESVWKSYDHHTVELAPAIASALERTGSLVTDVQAVGVAIGPGSFTGLRIGLALAKGMALARRLPLIGVPTLDILAAAQPVRAASLVAVLQAGRGHLACAWYLPGEGSWQAIGDIEAMNVDELARRIQSETLVCGELAEEERRILARKRKKVILASAAHSLRRPSFLAELAWQRLLAGKVDDPATVAPRYIHHGDAIPDGAN